MPVITPQTSVTRRGRWQFPRSGPRARVYVCVWCARVCVLRWLGPHRGVVEGGSGPLTCELTVSDGGSIWETVDLRWNLVLICEE